MKTWTNKVYLWYVIMNCQSLPTTSNPMIHHHPNQAHNYDNVWLKMMHWSFLTLLSSGRIKVQWGLSLTGNGHNFGIIDCLLGIGKFRSSLHRLRNMKNMNTWHWSLEISMAFRVKPKHFLIWPIQAAASSVRDSRSCFTRNGQKPWHNWLSFGYRQMSSSFHSLYTMKTILGNLLKQIRSTDLSRSPWLSELSPKTS